MHAATRLWRKGYAGRLEIDSEASVPYHDNHRLHSPTRLLKIVSMNLPKTRALQQSPSWRSPASYAVPEMPHGCPIITGLPGAPKGGMNGRMDGPFRPSKPVHFRVASLDTLRRTETGLSHRKQSVTKVTTRHSYRNAARINLSPLGGRNFSSRVAASASSFAVRCHSERAQRVGISLRAPIPATTISAAQRLLGGRSFSSDKNDGVKRLPLAVQFPRASSLLRPASSLQVTTRP